MSGSNLRNFIDQNEQEMKQTIRNYVNKINVVNSKLKSWRFGYKTCPKFLLQMYLLHEMLTILVTNLLVMRNINISCDKFISHLKCQLSQIYLSL